MLVHGQLVRRFYRSGAGARSLTEVVASGIKKLEVLDRTPGGVRASSGIMTMPVRGLGQKYVDFCGQPLAALDHGADAVGRRGRQQVGGDAPPRATTASAAERRARTAASRPAPVRSRSSGAAPAPWAARPRAR